MRRISAMSHASDDPATRFVAGTAQSEERLGAIL